MDALQTIFLSFVLSFFVGMERQLSKKPVGFAPYVLVTVISTALTIVSLEVFSNSQSVVISGIITGVGFLGAGALIRYHEKVFGFTTASAVWAMAGFGVLIGLASTNLVLILSTYLIIWAILIVDKLIALRGWGRHMRTISIEAKGISSHKDIKDIIGRYHDSKEEGMEMNFDRGVVEYKFLVPEAAKIDPMMEELSKLKDVKKIQMD